MGGPIITAATALSAAGAAMAWAARGRSSSVFGGSVWHGPRSVRAVALTFDDGPSAGTAELLDVLSEHGIPATFFVCGRHARRHPEILRSAVARGHEIGNHTDTHPPLWMRSVAFIRDEIARCQIAIEDTAGCRATLFRAPYGVRWFGLREVQREFGLTGVMWSIIGRDWALPAEAVAQRIVRRVRNGDIICLHDGRELDPAPRIGNTIDAVRIAVPTLLQSGYKFHTVSQLIRYSGAVCPTTSSNA